MCSCNNSNTIETSYSELTPEEENFRKIRSEIDDIDINLSKLISDYIIEKISLFEFKRLVKIETDKLSKYADQNDKYKYSIYTHSNGEYALLLFGYAEELRIYAGNNKKKFSNALEKYHNLTQNSIKDTEISSD